MAFEATTIDRVAPWTHERLAGARVVLEPLEERHREPLRAAAADPEVFRYFTVDLSQPGNFDPWFDDALAELTFATTVDGTPVGSSRYLSLAPEHRSVEIGWTWLHPSVWGSGVNVEAKFLQLQHAFETWGCRRVEWKTDAANERSCRALAALGATFEGVHRNHMLVRGGENRDSAWFSVVDAEWPQVREALRRRLAR